MLIFFCQKNLNKFKPPVDIAGIMEETGFTIEHERTDGLMRFIHEDFKVEFITEAGAKGNETVHRFKNLSITAQELHFMTIPIDYNIQVPFKDIVVRIPEPQAFALHKLIVSQRRATKMVIVYGGYLTICFSMSM